MRKASFLCYVVMAAYVEMHQYRYITSAALAGPQMAL